MNQTRKPTIRPKVSDDLNAAQAKTVIRKAATPLLMPISGTEDFVRVTRGAVNDFLDGYHDSEWSFMVVEHDDQTIVWPTRDY